MEKTITRDRSYITRLHWWAPVVAWMGFIFTFSSHQRIVASDQEVVNFFIFKTLHVIEYATLFVLSARAFHGSNPSLGKKDVFLRAAGITMIYAFTDEYHQLFVPTREGRLRDVIIDAIGASVGWISLVHIRQRVPNKLQRLARVLGIFF